MDAAALTQTKLTYSVAEVAAATGISRGLVYRLLAQGKLQSVKLGDRRLIPTRELEQLLSTSAETK